MDTYRLERNLQFGSDWEIVVSNTTEKECNLELMHQKMKFPDAKFRIVPCSLPTPTT